MNNGNQVAAPIHQLPLSIRLHVVDSFNSSELVTTENQKVSLICPISKKRIATPVRSKECRHLQCFDAQAYYSLNCQFNIDEKPWSWKCPTCSAKAPFSSLVVDSYFALILESVPEKTTTIVFARDGSWSPEIEHVGHVSVIDLSDDDDKMESEIPISVKLTSGKTITLEVKPSLLVDEVQEMIKAKEGILPSCQNLRFFGTKLESGRTLSDYNIKKMSMLHQGFEILVKMLTGKSFTLEVDPSTKIENVKKLINDKGIPSDYLFCDGKQLKDGHTLSDYKIKEYSIIQSHLRLFCS